MNKILNQKKKAFNLIDLNNFKIKTSFMIE